MTSNPPIATCPNCGLTIESAALGAHQDGDRCRELAAANVAVMEATEAAECGTLTQTELDSAKARWREIWCRTTETAQNPGGDQNGNADSAASGVP